MTQHDEVVERLAREKWNRTLLFGGETTWDVLRESEHKPMREDMRLILADLNCGDSLPNGLWAAPEEPTEAMVNAGCQHENMGDMAGRYKAMRRAAGGDNG